MDVKRGLIVFGLLFPSYLFGQMLFPAFTVMHALMLIFPFIALGMLMVEGMVYSILEEALSVKKIMFLLLFSNIISWVLGVILGSFLPSGLVFEGESRVLGERFAFYASLSLIYAYVLSVLLEASFFRLLKGKLGVSHPYKLAFWANSWSYGLSIAVIYLFELR